MFNVYAADHLRTTNARTEDGEYVVVADWVVVAELADGRRFHHEVTFPGRAGYTPEEGFGYGIDGDKAAAERLAGRVNLHLAAGGELDPARWNEVDPCYGSEAYVAQGIGERDWMEERMEAMGYAR